MLSINDRYEIVQLISKGLCRGKVAEKFKVSKAAITKIMKRKDEVIKQYRENDNVSSKRINLNDFGKKLDQHLYTWFLQSRAKGLTVSDAILVSKAKEIANKLGKEDFGASGGFLECFKRRHSISSKLISGESGSVDTGIVNDWMSKLKFNLQGYEARDIFNCDETGLFFKGVPNRTLATKADKCRGRKARAERMTILLTTSILGEKMDPLVIWKSKMPRCFKKKIPSGIHWFANKSAWMNSAVFLQYLEDLNKRMFNANRKILLLLDNAPVHVSPTLSNVKLLFFKPNTTCVCQPLDSGIIRVFKLYYRNYLVKELVRRYDSITAGTAFNIEAVIQSIQVSTCIEWIKKSWSDVKATTILHCFRKSGFNKDVVQGLPAETTPANSPRTAEPAADTTATSNTSNAAPEITVVVPDPVETLIRETEESFELNINILGITDPCYDEGPIETFDPENVEVDIDTMQNEAEDTDSADDSDGEVIIAEPVKITTYTDAVSASRILFEYSLQTQDDTDTLFEKLRKQCHQVNELLFQIRLREEMTKKKRQLTLDSFIAKKVPRIVDDDSDVEIVL